MFLQEERGINFSKRFLVIFPLILSILIMSARLESPMSGPIPTSGSIDALSKNDFIKGMAFYDQQWDAYANDAIKGELQSMPSIGTNFVSITVYFDMKNCTSNTLHYAAYSPTNDSIRQFIRNAHNLGLKVMFKPHVSCEDGRWGGRIYPTDWNAWFVSYRTLLNEYAQLCQEEHVEIFCVGNELSSSTGSDEYAPYPHQANFNAGNWLETIRQVRGIYSGNLTYAAHAWQVLDDSFPYYALDYIGVNAYFNVSQSLNDSVSTIVQNWETMSSNYGRSVSYTDWKQTLVNLAAEYNKKVLFTEVAYYDLFANVNTTFPTLQEQQWQSNCYEALFEVWHNSPIISGIFWWEWCAPSRAFSWIHNMGPQDKLAENIVSQWFS